MRRFIALVIMLVVPLQFTWAAALAVQGHGEPRAAGMHDQGDAYHELAHGCHAKADADGAGGETQGKDTHHSGHCHHIFSFILHQHDAPVGPDLKGGPIRHAPAAFASRIPPLLDRPPLARA